MFRYDRLDELVKETGLKKNYLSTKIGHTGRYLNDAKKQNTDIKLAEVQVLAKELGTTAEYLRGETDQKNKPTLISESELDETTKELFDILTNATEEEREALLNMARLIKRRRD